MSDEENGHCWACGMSATYWAMSQSSLAVAEKSYSCRRHLNMTAAKLAVEYGDPYVTVKLLRSTP